MYSEVTRNNLVKLADFFEISENHLKKSLKYREVAELF